MKSFKLSVFILSTLFSTGMSVQNAPQLRADNIDEVINAMTTEEKAQWLGEAGDYAVEVGDNVEDITSSVKVRLSEYTEKVHHVMKPDAQLNLLRQ